MMKRDSIRGNALRTMISRGRSSAWFMAALLLLTAVMSSARADTMNISEEHGCAGDQVMVTIWMTNETTQVDAFVIRFSYDTTMLDYVRCEPGDLNPGWTMFDCNDLTPGQITLGGFGFQVFVPPGSSGSFVRVYFTVTCPGCSDGDYCDLNIVALLDDLEGFTALNGRFTYLCSTPTPYISPTPSLYTATPLPPSPTPPPSTPTPVTPTPPPPTLTPTRTPTPSTPSPTPTSPPPTLTPTPTATQDAPTNTPAPPTATPTPGGFSLSLTMPKVAPACYAEGDECWLSAEVLNGFGPFTADFYCVLDVYGTYFFYPSWGGDLTFERVLIPAGSSTLEILPAFLWPGGTGAADALYFYAAFMTEGTIELFGNVDFVEFCYR